MAGSLLDLDEGGSYQVAQLFPKQKPRFPKSKEEEDFEDWVPPWVSNPRTQQEPDQPAPAPTPQPAAPQPPSISTLPETPFDPYALGWMDTPVRPSEPTAPLAAPSAPAPQAAMPQAFDSSRFNRYLDELEALAGAPYTPPNVPFDPYQRGWMDTPQRTSEPAAPAAPIAPNTAPPEPAAKGGSIGDVVTSFLDWSSSTSKDVLGRLPAARAERSEGKGALGTLGMLSPEERVAAARSELETATTTQQLSANARSLIDDSLAPDAVKSRVAGARKKITEGDAQKGIEELVGELGVAKMGKSVAKGVIDSYATRQEERLAVAQEMVAGTREPPEMSSLRNAFDVGAKTIADTFATGYIKTVPILAHLGNQATRLAPGWEPTDSAIYKLGERVEAVAKRAFPGDPGRQYEFTTTLSSGVASTAAFAGQGVVLRMAGLGEKGVLAAIALSGAALQTPNEFEQVTKALKLGKATERDRIIVTLANLGLGATEAAPFMPGGIKGTGVRSHLLRAGEQAVEEGSQEFLQQVGSNAARKYTYKPDQDLYEGAAEGMLVGGLTGGAFGLTQRGEAKSASPPNTAPSERKILGKAMQTIGERHGDQALIDAGRRLASDTRAAPSQPVIQTPFGQISASSPRSSAAHSNQSTAASSTASAAPPATSKSRYPGLEARARELEAIEETDYERFVSDGLQFELDMLRRIIDPPKSE